MKALPALPPSVLNIPVKVAIAPLLRQAESMAPKEIRSDGWPAYLNSGCDFRYKYRFVRSGFQFSCVNNHIVVAMTGSYQIAGSQTVCILNQSVSPWINGSCGFPPESMRRVSFSLYSDLRFLPDYHLQTSTQLEKIQAIDKCTVTIFKNDVTGQVLDSIASSVNAYGTTIDNLVSQLNFDKYLQPIAEKAGKKIPLSTYGYLKLNANAVNMGAINYLSDTLRFTAGIHCFPEISSDSINHSVTRFLPPLGNAPAGNDFNLTANAVYDYTTIDTLLTRTLRNREFEVKGEKIRIVQVEVRGLDQYRVEFKIVFTGTKKGTLFLTGTPVLDPVTQSISVPDLEYDLNSSSLVLVLGKTFFSRQILQNLREQAKVNVQELYNKNKSRIDSQLNRNVSDGVTLQGSTRSLRLNGLVINKDNVQVQANVQGALQMVITKTSF
ncbi:hypothetical protein FPE01S_06_00010 [Flavihumibacter petaseus NBRC 106054]|uniref:DUF4403 family protein n=1 Tax=Flavihumibacter petaseus NBRC 106054 TaxID=1220578 RepID=A0A0E9N812_9BACT|nr:hypothetical protein FPE01S_06_00010 [Flavihumibacter petaseus NBRC 106054]